MSQGLLSLRAVSATRGHRTVVDRVDLSLHAGEWVALVGPNGAGKSTLLQLAAGLLVPAAGEVWLGERALAAWPDRARARQLAWLAQSPEADADMLVRDVVELGRLAHRGWLGWGGKATVTDRSVVDEAMGQADVRALVSHRLGRLSGGERQRVHLARALATQAPVLLLDEPLAHLDPPHQRHLARVMRQAARAGHALLSVMHELPIALSADRLAVMGGGRLLASGPASDPAVRAALCEVFDHAIELLEVDGRWTAWPRL
ncbi:MAG: ABC transporter ATP-binding protein [Gammaproteobacteria bacterium]|nr:ABC transporter ATP-binding protein [Gammaproteobacteria bacterium]